MERRRRGPDFFANYRRVLDDVALTRPDVVAHDGDFFAHSHVSQRVVAEAYGPLAALAESGAPVVLVLATTTDRGRDLDAAVRLEFEHGTPRGTVPLDESSPPALPDELREPLRDPRALLDHAALVHTWLKQREHGHG